jgi:hypothetical protein
VAVRAVAPPKYGLVVVDDLADEAVAVVVVVVEAEAFRGGKVSIV